MSLIAGKYEVIRELGQGSTGAVYLVRHRDLGFDYALKLLNREFSADERFISRFKREAKILEALAHPGSATLRDFGRTADGLYYMTMDYCEGRSLKDAIEAQERFALPVALDISSQVLDVLAAAHAVGIIHRDIKPDNIILTETPAGRYRARILDFGIAKITQEVEIESSVTARGTAVGTPWYMSPEQAAGEAQLDHRVDLYAVGVLMYEMICGELPFKGQTVLQTLLLHLTQPPPPWPPDLGIPFEVEQVVRKALKKDPSERYQSAEEFQTVVNSFLMEAAPPPLPEYQPEPEPVEEEATPEPEIFLTPSPDGDEGEPTKILCLDDNPMILDILSHILQREGYTVFTATDSSSIHSYLFQERVELLITDVKMPGIEGSEVCSMLKQTMRHLKIVLFSSLPERELETLAKQSRADGWISKNTKPDQWLQRVDEFLHGSAKH